MRLVLTERSLGKTKKNVLGHVYVPWFGLICAQVFPINWAYIP